MARKYLQFQGDRVFYSNAQGDPDGNWQEWQDPTGKIKGIFNVAQYFKDNPILQNSNFPPNSANNLVGKTLFSSSEFTQYFIGQPIGVPVVTPTPTPAPIIISNEAQIILNKFDNGDYLIPSGVNAGIELVKNGSVTSELFVSTFNNLLNSGLITDKTITPTYDFIIEPDGKVRMFRIGSVEYTEIKIFPENVQSYIDRNIGRLLTAQERAIPYPRPQPEPELTFCVNVYNIRDSGSVYSTHYESITQQKVEELKQTQYVISCSDTTLPTEKQIQDFYGFTPLPPAVDTSIDSTMVSQSIGAFILKDGRIKGEILYIANQSFNPFYYGKNLTSLVQIKSKTGVGIAIKPNNLNFTQTQRDERIQINEDIGNLKELTIDFFVWDSPISMLPFSETKQIQVVEELPPPDPFDPQPPSTCEIGFHKDFSGKCVPDDPIGELPRDKLIDTLKGFLFGTVALSLLARKY